MIRNATVTLGIATSLVNDEGGIVKTWDFGGTWDDSTTWDDVGQWTDDAVSFVCDVQPAVLSEYVYQNWGISDLKSDSKLMFMDWTLADFWGLVSPVNRVQVAGDLVYDVLGSNKWQRHQAALLAPVQGEAA